MHLDDDSFFSFHRAPRVRSRTFLRTDHETANNLNAWREGLEATRTGDPVGMARARDIARGSVQLIGRTGLLRRDPISKAVLKLRDDPAAWRRLKTSQAKPWDPLDAPEAQPPEWTPGPVDMLSFMWSHNPKALALAARVWREKCHSTQTWFNCPFLVRPWQGQFQLEPPLFRAIRTHKPQLDSNPMWAAAHIVPDAEAGPELEALEAIFTETARASLESLAPFAPADRASRVLGKKVWAHSTSLWGLSWTRHFEEQNQTVSAFPPPLTCAQRAIDAIVADAFARDSAHARESLALLAMSLQDTHFGALSQRTLDALFARDPQGACALPFGPHDWMSLNLVSRLTCSDEQLSRFFAGDGRSWSAPAFIEYSGQLRAGAPAWSHLHEPSRYENKAEELDGKDWTILEWALIMGRPQAVLLACQLGAKLRPHFEALIGSALQWKFQTSKLEAQACAEACRIAESIYRPEPVPSSGRIASRL